MNKKQDRGLKRKRERKINQLESRIEELENKKEEN